MAELIKRPSLFYVDQPYIIHGYRANPNMNVAKCIKSAVMFHNESLNSWSHLIGGLYFAY